MTRKRTKVSPSTLSPAAKFIPKISTS